jgi:hypothetical protein
MDEVAGFFFVIAIAIIIALGVVNVVDDDLKEYETKIEHTYEIDITENLSDYIVYNDGACVAIKLPYDKLERVGCGENAERLVVKN